jgi:hypothetical protein
MEELGREGWGVIEGPMMLRSVDPGIRGNQPAALLGVPAEEDGAMKRGDWTRT